MAQCLKVNTHFRNLTPTIPIVLAVSSKVIFLKVKSPAKPVKPIKKAHNYSRTKCHYFKSP